MEGQWLEKIGLVLAVAAMLIGIWHLWEIRNTANRLDSVRKALSTRYLGQFPDFVPEIIAHLERAKKKITIFCDFPAYGHFSSRRRWLEYGQTIQRKIYDKLQVSLTCFDEQRRFDFNKEQFPRLEDWERWKSDPPTRNKIQELLQSRGLRPDVEALSKEEFAQLLEDTEREMLDKEFLNAQVLEVNAEMPLYFWIIDDQEAIFAIPSYWEEATEYGFVTSDTKLISAFQQIVNRYRRRYSDVTDANTML